MPMSETDRLTVRDGRANCIPCSIPLSHGHYQTNGRRQSHCGRAPLKSLSRAKKTPSSQLPTTQEAAAMETRSCSLLLLTISSALFLAPGRNTKLAQGQKTWCIAKPSSDDATLAANLNYACSQVNCSILQRGYGCFHPDTLMSHASIAMNLYYQARGRNFWNCYFKGSGLVAIADPSFGSCVYAYG